MKSFEFYNPEHLIFGNGTFAQLETLPMPGKKACIVCTPSRRYVDRAIEMLGKNGVECVVYDKCRQNPDTRTINLLIYDDRPRRYLHCFPWTGQRDGSHSVASCGRNDDIRLCIGVSSRKIQQKNTGHYQHDYRCRGGPCGSLCGASRGGNSCMLCAHGCPGRRSGSGKRIRSAVDRSRLAQG